MFWVIRKIDDAILGYKSGIQSQQVIGGPFKEYEEAEIEKNNYFRYSSTYYTIQDSESKPKEYEKEYDFVDYDSEFSDY